MLGKKFLAGIFAGLILLKMIMALTSANKWIGFTQALLGHQTAMMVIYLALFIITGYFVLTSLEIIDIAVVMLFTSLLIGISLIPYSASLLKLQEEIAAAGLGRVWFAWVLWGAVALAVLYRVFSNNK